MDITLLQKENETLRLKLQEKDSIIEDCRRVIAEHTKIIADKEALIAEKQALIAELKEKVALLEILHFGPKSEKWTKDDERQGLLFNEAEDEAFRQTEATGAKSGVETKEVCGYTRRAHRNQGRKPISPDLPREEIVYDISEDEKVCGCGSKLICIGEDVSERVAIKPAEVRVIRERRKKYACRVCEGVEDERGGVVTAEGAKHLLPGSLADESLLAWSICEKFEFGLPFYRQAKRLLYIGVPLSRGTLCHHAIRAAEACRPLYELLGEQIRSGPVINADETRVQVLKEPGRRPQDQSWMWVFVGGPAGHEAVLFRYDRSRSHEVCYQFLQGFQGWLQTDGYGAYETALKRIGESDAERRVAKHILCWSHVRRMFVRAWEVSRSPLAKEAIDFIRKLFALEELRKEYSLKGFFKQRLLRAKDIFFRFESWLCKVIKETPASCLLGKAVAYVLENWGKLTCYVEDPVLVPSNNRVENAIRPFVVGRKNWLFSDTPLGAEASAIHYSLIESAKLSNLNPYAYLIYVFSRLPYASSREDYQRLLPWNLSPNLLRGG